MTSLYLDQMIYVVPFPYNQGHRLLLWPISLVPLLSTWGVPHKKEQNVGKLGKKCEWRNPNPNPLGQRYPQSCVSTGPVPSRAWAHLVSSAPACRGAALTRFASPWLGHSPSLVWQALADEDLCLNTG